jgi:hypothetical protein
MLENSSKEEEFTDEEYEEYCKECLQDNEFYISEYYLTDLRERELEIKEQEQDEDDSEFFKLFDL